MGQDIRGLFEEDRKTKKFHLKQGHKKRFLERLKKELPKQNKSQFLFLRVAASVLVIISIGMYTYSTYRKESGITTTIVDKDDPAKVGQSISLADLSPDLKKIENYYMANINLELSKLQISNRNKTMVDDFMYRLSELNQEYKKLNIELNQIGPNDQTITALIKNLQLRLQLLHK
ncbi:MAG: hypothetical protein QM485_14735, partial [Flavobacteriaceae bacterium]